MPIQKSIKDRFELFNQKVGKLENLSFAKRIAGSKFRLRGEKGKPFVVERTGPRGEQFDAFILTLRLFMQDNDGISIRKIKKCYDSLPLSTEIINQFNSSREEFNKYLDSKSSLDYNDKNFTNREILEIMIYGEYSHLNKREIYNRVMNFAFFGDLFNNEFIHITGNFLNFLKYIRELNLKAMKEIMSNAKKE